MSVQEVLEAVKELSPEERETVGRLIDSLDTVKLVPMEYAEAMQKLLADGTVMEIKRPSPDLYQDSDYSPVPIRGEPLSRTILEERR